jgi:hypothetical protein
MHFPSNTAATSMTSREIADLVGSRHDDVKRSIERLAGREVIEFPPVAEISTSTKPLSVYVFSGEKGKRDSIIVVAQLSPEFTARLVDRWQELEANAAAAMPLSGDPRIDKIAQSLRLGLIDQEEARLRTRAILDGDGTPRAVKPSKPAKPRALPAPQRWPLAEWSGEPVINIGDDHWPFSEIAYFVKGGERALIRAMQEGGFITAAGRPTAKGAHLAAGKRHGRQLFKTRTTLKAIGAWPK